MIPHSLNSSTTVQNLPVCNLSVINCSLGLIRMKWLLNLIKTKEMVFGPPSITSNLPPISASSYQKQRASNAKLLDLHIDSNLSWHTHVEAIVSKASQRLYFLKQLQHAGVPHTHLLHFYISVIRPVLEYAVPVWHHLTKAHTDSVESVQKRGLRIIYSFSNDIPYSNSRCCRYC